MHQRKALGTNNIIKKSGQSEEEMWIQSFQKMRIGQIRNRSSLG